MLATGVLACSLVLGLDGRHDDRPDAAAASTRIDSTPDSATVARGVTGAVRGSRTSPVSPYRVDRRRPVSRSAPRVVLTKLPKVTKRLFRTGNLNLWPAPRERGKPLAVLPEGGRVAATGVRRGGFAEIVLGGRVRWVNQDYLAVKRPVAATSPGSAPSGSSSVSTAGLSSAPCPDGSGTESGLTSAAVRLFRAACNAFPALSSYGGYDGHGEHSSGRAIDFMTGDHALGQALADWARAHAGELNLYDVIYYQHIWTPQRASEGWRAMPDRGSATANHYDHAHISVN